MNIAEIKDQRQADEEAMLQHAFHGQPLDPSVLRRIEERANIITERIRREHGEIDDETLNQLLRDARDNS
ncbi:hypothetical protein BH10PLA2_BH10PLA2_31850 [soil metagenome]